MLNVQGWPTADIVTAGARATVAGRSVKLVSVSTKRELPRTLPGQVAMAGGITAATGSLVIAPVEDVSGRVATPWTSRTYPKRGERVQIWVSHDGAEARIFTGRVDSTSGDVSSREISVDVVDDFDKLNTEFSHRPVARMMPPLSTIGNGFQRMTGLLSSWVTDLAARAAGFYATPPMDGYCLVSAPLQGSTWPERGELRDSYRGDNVGIWHKYHPGAVTQPEGWLAMSHLYAMYEPDPYNTPYNSGITSARPLNLTMMAGRTQATSSYVAAHWAGGYMLRLAVTGSRDVVAQAVATDGTVTNVAFIGVNSAGAWTTATARWRPSGAVSLAVDLTTDTGASATGAMTPPSTAGVFTDPITQVRVYAPQGCYIAGAQASFTTLPPASSWSRTAAIRPSTPLRNMTLVPALTTRSAGELLKAQAEAEISALWIDEDGRLQYRDRASLLSGSVVKTLTSKRDLLGLSWSTDSQDARRKVTVKYRDAAVSITRRSTLVAYEGQKEELHEGEDQEVFIEPPEDEEWLMVDSTPRTILSDFNADKFNSGEGSFVGFTGLNKDGDEYAFFDGSAADYRMTFELVGARAWRTTLSIPKMPPNVDRVITQSRSEDNSQIKRAYRGRGLPLLRCMGKGKWTDQEVTPGITGPSWATDLTHDAEWFIQSRADALALANEIAQATADPLPVFESIPIRPDPRLQLGDTVRVQDPDITGLSITGVVCGVDQSVKAGEHTMTVSLIVTKVDAAYPTLGEFDAWHAGKTLAEFEALWSGETLAALDAAPLSR